MNTTVERALSIKGHPVLDSGLFVTNIYSFGNCKALE